MPNKMTALIKAARSFNRSNAKTTAHRALGDQFGPSGALLGAMMDLFAGGGRTSDQDLARATKVMRDAGFSLNPGSIKATRVASPTDQILPPVTPQSREGRFNVEELPSLRQIMSPPTPSMPGETPGEPSSPPARGVGQPPVEDRTDRRPRVRRVGIVPQPGDSRRPGQVQREPSIGKSNDFVLGGIMPAEEGEDDPFKNEIMTPESSNVYAFTYDEKRGILYVTYRAPGDNLFYSDRTNSCTGKEYKMGHRANARGPMYAYGSAAKPVPKRVFEEMSAAGSKGEFVWQRLRVCGSLWGHQFPYALVSPSMAGILYVPRRATRQGFRVRAVPTVGKGRRPYVVSNLPEQLFG